MQSRTDEKSLRWRRSSRTRLKSVTGKAMTTWGWCWRSKVSRQLQLRLFGTNTEAPRHNADKANVGEAIWDNELPARNCSPGFKPVTSATEENIQPKLLRVWVTPFGFPVLPEVKNRKQGWSGSCSVWKGGRSPKFSLSSAVSSPRNPASFALIHPSSHALVALLASTSL